MVHDQLRTIIERYTPTMLGVTAPASREEISRLEALAGPLPSSYLDFLGWMGNRCPFLDGEELGYSPENLLDFVYEDPEIEVPNGFILIGVDMSGSCSCVHIRCDDGAIVRLDPSLDAVTNKDLLLENENLASFLLTSYVRKTLAPSHPFHFAAALNCDDNVQVQEVRRRIDEVCNCFNISYPIILPDFSFYGGDDFVLGLYQRPGASIVYIYVGTIEQSQHDAWHNLVFKQWRSHRMPG